MSEALSREQVEELVSSGIDMGSFDIQILGHDAALRAERDNLRLRINAVDAEHAEMERQKHTSINAFIKLEAERDAYKAVMQAPAWCDECRVLDSKYVDERSAKIAANEDRDLYEKLWLIEKREHATALKERDKHKTDSAAWEEQVDELVVERDDWKLQHELLSDDYRQMKISNEHIRAERDALKVERDEAMNHAAGMSNDVTHLGEQVANLNTKLSASEKARALAVDKLEQILARYIGEPS